MPLKFNSSHRCLKCKVEYLNLELLKGGVCFVCKNQIRLTELKQHIGAELKIKAWQWGDYVEQEGRLDSVTDAKIKLNNRLIWKKDLISVHKIENEVLK